METIRDVVVKLRLEQTGETSLKAPTIEKVKETLSDATATAAKSSKAIEKDIAEATKKVEVEAKKVETALDKISKKAEENLEKSLQLADGFVQFGEGALTTLRGVTLAMVDGNDELTETVEKVAQIQGFIDIFKGGIETVKGYTEGMKALKARTGAATAAQAAQAVVTKTVTVTTTAATTAVTALKAALGPVGLAIAGVTAAVGVLAVAWNFFFSDAEEEVEGTAKAFGKLEDNLETFGEQLDKFRQKADFAESIEQPLNDLARERIALLGEEERIAKTLIVAGREHTRVLTNVNRLADERVLKVKTAREANQIRAEAGIRIAQSNIRLARTEMDIQKERQNSLNREIQSARAIAMEAKDRLKSTKEQFLIEKQRAQTLKEQFGALDPERQLAIQRIAEKSRIGATLSQGELREIQQFAPNIAAQGFSGLADNAGFGAVSGLIQDDKTIADRRRKELEDAVRNDPNAQGELDVLKDIIKVNDDKIAGLNDVLEESRKLQEEELSLIESLLEQIANLRSFVQAIADEAQDTKEKREADS